MLELNNVHTSFGKKLKMLQDVSLTINKGEIVCLLGSNGSGKTTTIRTIIGLIKPDSGSITYKGERIDSLKTFQIINKGISLVPEGRRLFPKMAVLDNLKVSMRRKQDAAQFEQKLEEVFELFPRLKERSGQFAGTLSGGEQAMLAIGRAMVQAPELLILDEPSFGLAPILVEEFYRAIDNIRSTGVTVLLSEQNTGKALCMADRGYVLLKGVVQVSGNCDELIDNQIVRECYLGEGSANQAK